MSSFAIAILSIVAYCVCFTTVSSQNNFAVDFFKHAYEADQNAILAPIAIRTSLAMMHHVATPEGRRILRNGLYLPKSRSKVIKETKAAVRRINERKDSLEMLSKVYLPDVALNPELVPHLRDSFGADSEIVNFSDKSGVVDRVNTWVNDSSRGMIPKFLQADELSSDGTSLLINVMIMNASWGLFDEKNTVKQTFHFLNGDHEVDMMKVRGTLPQMYFEDLMTIAIKLPYDENTDLSMIILLPREETNLPHLIKHFTVDHYDRLTELDQRRWYGNIWLGVPRFKIKQKLNARLTLEKMGLGPLFQRDSFQVLDSRLSRLALVKQSAFIEVDEKGTRAVASTAVFTTYRSGWMVDVDRPFMFIVRKESSKDILFIGHYSNYEPSNEGLSE